MGPFIVDICRRYPELVVFLSIAVGYFLGRIKIKGFSLGCTASVLLVALGLGQMDIQIPALLKQVGFALFIFAIGYKVGPQFFGALKKEGLHYIWISLVVAFTGLAAALCLGKLFAFDPGTTAGILGGAMTQSTVIGTADGAILSLPVTAAERTVLQSNVAIAYAITYIFGAIGMIVLFKLLPKILRIDLRAQAKTIEKNMSGAEEETGPEMFSWFKSLNLRAYQAGFSGKTVRELEAMFEGKVVVEKVKHGDRVMEPTPDLIIHAGDKIALVGDRHEFLDAERLIGPEVDDRAVVDIIGEIVGVCVLNKEVVGKTLGEISKRFGHKVFLRRVTRMGHELPLTRDTVVNKCDVLHVSGARKDVEEFVRSLGYAERFTVQTDLVMVGFGCVLGILVGIVAIPVAGIPITLGVGGGILISGLFFGWLRAVHPTFGQIPAGAQWVFTDLGLNLFIACVGLTAGTSAVHALKTTGGPIFLAGIVVTLAPAIVGLIFGRLVLRLDPALLFGALTGAQTATPALNAVKEEADSSVPALGFAVPYAFGNVVLTIWGTVIVHVIKHL